MITVICLAFAAIGIACVLATVKWEERKNPKKPDHEYDGW